MLLRVVGVVLGSLLLAATAVMFTAHAIMAHYHATGGVPSPLSAALLLLAVLILEIGTIFLLYKGIRFVMARGENSSRGGSSPPAPPTTSSAAAGADDGSSSAHRFGRRIRYVYNDFVGRLASSGPHNNNNGGGSSSLYAPLTGDAEEGTYVAPSAPAAATALMYHHHPAEPVPVQLYYTPSAAPITPVHMI
jgi:hypothetical protein